MRTCLRCNNTTEWIDKMNDIICGKCRRVYTVGETCVIDGIKLIAGDKVLLLENKG